MRSVKVAVSLSLTAAWRLLRHALWRGRRRRRSAGRREAIGDQSHSRCQGPGWVVNRDRWLRARVRTPHRASLARYHASEVIGRHGGLHVIRAENTALKFSELLP